jgi:hypothetical protein
MAVISFGHEVNTPEQHKAVAAREDKSEPETAGMVKKM